MKKILIVLLCILMTSGCNKQETIINNNEDIDIKEDISNKDTGNDKYIDDNPIVVGLYLDGKLIKDINVDVKDNTDITVIDVYYTNELDTGSTSTKYNFIKYYNNYEDIDKYKIGFYISFYNTDNELIEGIIKSPKDMYILSPYIYNYLYDDVHQEDYTFYSHVEEDEVNEETVYSCIKLYAVDGNKILSPITLTVFTYDDLDDFDENGYYRGNSKYTVNININ